MNIPAVWGYGCREKTCTIGEREVHACSLFFEGGGLFQEESSFNVRTSEPASLLIVLVQESPKKKGGCEFSRRRHSGFSSSFLSFFLQLHHPFLLPFPFRLFSPPSSLSRPRGITHVNCLDKTKLSKDNMRCLKPNRPARLISSLSADECTKKDLNMTEFELCIHRFYNPSNSVDMKLENWRAYYKTYANTRLETEPPVSGGSRRYRRPFAYVTVMNGAGAEIERPRCLDEPHAGFCHILSLPLTDGHTERRCGRVITTTILQ